MHLHRLMALAGAIIGIIGLFFSGLTTDGKSAMATIHQQNNEFADGIPTIWGGLEGWAQVLLVILIIVTVALAVMPDRLLSYDRNGAGITAVVGLALLAYAFIKYLDASDSADELEGGFAQLAAGGFPGVQAWTVAPSIGFFVLMIGTVLVLAAGIMSLVANKE